MPGPDALRARRQEALLELLRAAEAAGGRVDVDELAAASGYAPASIRTYFTKRLEGVLVFRETGGTWRVRGALSCRDEEFRRRMSQKAGTTAGALGSEDTWRGLVRKLLYEGQRRHYTLTDEETALVVALADGAG